MPQMEEIYFSLLLTIGYYHGKLGGDVDPECWKVKKVKFDSTYTGDTLGKEKEVKGKSIKKAIKMFKSSPEKYTALMYQTSLLKKPPAKHIFHLVYRKNTICFRPMGVHKDGWMTLMTNEYERLPAFPDNEFPENFRDKWTDSMTYQGQLIHSSKK
jgi:hypothetical protein